MEDRDIIERFTAAWLSPIVLVNEPDGSKRICLDCRHVNKHLATDVYPLPRLEEVVEQTAGHPYFVTLDNLCGKHTFKSCQMRKVGVLQHLVMGLHYIVSKDYLSALIAPLLFFHDAWHPSSLLSSNRDG